MSKVLADHERAHPGTPGSKVRHGADAIGKADTKYANLRKRLEFEDSSESANEKKGN